MSLPLSGIVFVLVSFVGPVADSRSEKGPASGHAGKLERALLPAVRAQMPLCNGIPSKDDPPLATDDGPLTSVFLAEDVLRDTAIRELEDEHTDDDTGDPVALHNGMVSQRVVDLHCAGRGLDFDLARRYDSHRASGTSTLGFGWQHSFEIAVRFLGATAERANGNGRLDVYQRVDAEHYSAPPGSYTRLSWSANDSAWILRSRHGVKTVFRAIAGDASGLFRAVWIADRHGNRLTLEYASGGRLDAVVDTLGRRVAFFYDAFGMLERVRDFAGREVVYTRDASGDLVSVRTPVVLSTQGFADAPAGYVETYTYHKVPTALAHHLASIVHRTENAAGTHAPFVRFEYERSQLSPFVGWVTSQQYGRGANASSIRYAYALSNTTVPFGALGVERLVTTVTDRRGCVTQYAFNENGNALELREMLNATTTAVTRFDYDADGEVTRIVRPQGDSEVRTRQGGTSAFARGNLVRIDRYPGPRGADQVVRTLRFEWEPVFQHALSRTDERGARTEWACDWMEGSAVAGGANDVRSAIANELGITQLEAAVLVAPWLHDADLNGDGIRAVVHGDLLQRVEPRVTLNALGGAPLAAAQGSAEQTAIHSATYDAYGRVTSDTDAEENVTVRVYTPADDLDGDHQRDANAPASADSLTGGWLARTIEDKALPFAHVQLANVMPRALASDVRRDCGVDPSPAFVERTTDFVHDVLGRTIAEFDARGVRTDFAFDELDRCWQTIRASDVSRAALRHGGCEPSSSEDLSGQAFAFVTRTRFDPDGRAVLVLEQNTGDSPDRGLVHDFHETSFSYDVEGRMTARAEEYGADGQLAIRAFVHDPNGNVTDEIDPEGGVVHAEFDARDRCASRTRGYGTSAASTETFAYDTSGNLLEHLDGRGFKTTLAYDGFDRLVSSTNASGSERRFEFDAASNVTSVSYRGVANGASSAIVDLRRVEYAYDERSRLSRIDRLDPRHSLDDGALIPGDARVTTVIELDRRSRLVFRIGDGAEVDAAAWDGVSRRISRRDALGNRVESCFDDRGNEVRTTQTDVYPDGHTRSTSTTRAFDALGRETNSSNALGHTQRTLYGSRSVAIATIDANGNTVRFAHDGLGRPTAESRDMRVGGVGSGAIESQFTTTRAWDRAGRLVEMTDDRGATTRFDYDALGRHVRERRPDGSATVLEFDACDAVVAVTDPRGCRVESTRDADGRVVRVDRVTADASIVGTASQRFEYDGLGRRTKSVDSVDAVLGNGDDWTVVREFDAFGRVLSEVQNGRAVLSTWRGEDERTSISYPSGMALGLAHDALHRVTSISQGVVEIAHYAYAGRERRIECRLANGIESKSADALGDDAAFVDAALRPLRLDHVNSAGIAARFDDALDPLGRRTSERRVHAARRGDNAVYDSAGRLVRFECDVAPKYVGSPASGEAGQLEAWSLDGAQSWSRSIVDGHEQRARIDANGAYTEFGSERLTHDANGNWVGVDDAGSQPLVLEYDCFDRLRRLHRGAASVEHDYDAEGRRVRTRTTNVPGAEACVEYVYDQWREIEQVACAGNVLRRTVHGVRVDEPLRVEIAGVGILYLLDSPSGDVAAVTDANGVVLERITYDAYGTPHFETPQSTPKNVASSDFRQPYAFKGMRFDAALVPLYDARARAYSPRHGRFLQRDPLGAWSDAWNCGNPYAFVGSDPWNCADPFGLERRVPVWLHEGLSWVGFIPVVGTGADFVDGVLYLCDGENGEAALAMAAAVPLFGDELAAARKLAKLEKELVETKKLKKVGKDVVDRLKKLGEHPHDLKTDAGGSLSDIYRDRAGELYTGDKQGKGFAERMWINLKELFE